MSLCCTVPQVLAMMVDLEEEEDWAVQDEIDNEDEDRYTSHYPKVVL